MPRAAADRAQSGQDFELQDPAVWAAGQTFELQDPLTVSEREAWAVANDDEDVVRLPPSLKDQVRRDAPDSPAGCRSFSAPENNTWTSEEDNLPDLPKPKIQLGAAHAMSSGSLLGMAPAGPLKDVTAETRGIIRSQSAVQSEEEKKASWMPRFFGFSNFGNLVDSTNTQELAQEVVELALAVCIATGPDIAGFVDHFKKEDIRALRRLSSTGRMAGLIGKTPTLDIPTTLSELTAAFLKENIRSPGVGPGLCFPGRSRDTSKNSSTQGLGAAFRALRSSSSLQTAVSPSQASKEKASGPLRQVTINEFREELEIPEDAPAQIPEDAPAPQDANGLQQPRPGLEQPKRGWLTRNASASKSLIFGSTPENETVQGEHPGGNAQRGWFARNATQSKSFLFGTAGTVDLEGAAGTAKQGGGWFSRSFSSAVGDDSSMKKPAGVARSVSDLSCTSYTDFNRKNKTDKLSRVSLLDFLNSLSMQNRMDGPFNMKEEQQMFLDISLPRIGEGLNSAMQAQRTPTNKSCSLDTVSEAGLSYHSVTALDCVLGGGMEKEVIQAEVLTDGENNGHMRIAFKSRCLRTQNEWQRQLLTQQRMLLKMVSSKLKATEQSREADGELLGEQKELLRGFRKIILRSPAEETAKQMAVYIFEADDSSSQDLQEMCKILEYPCKPFKDMTEATKVVRDMSIPDLPVHKVFSGQSQGTSIGSDSSTLASRDGSILEGRPGADAPDWRSRALYTHVKKNKMSPEDQTVKIVLLSAAWLEEDLPKEWKERGVFVVLTSQPDEFEEVGRALLASGESEIREKLRMRGISDYLLHPLSLDSLQGVVSQAYRTRFGDEYLLLQAMGRGVSGVVHKARRLSDCANFALKEINTKRLGKQAKDEILRESKLLQEMKWPTVVFLVDTWENTVDRLRYMLMPLLEGGNMLMVLDASQKAGPDSKECPPPTPETIADWYAQTLHGITYLHWRGVLHRDLKPGNLLLGADGRTLQVGDLGSAMLLPGLGPHPARWNKIKASITTPLYSPPEVLLEDSFNTGSDIWAIGATFYEALTMKTVIAGGTKMTELQEQIQRFDWHKGTYKDDLKKFRDIGLPPAVDMPELLHKDCMKRPAACNLVGRPVTYQKLRRVLEEVGALPSRSDRQAHFEDLAKVRRESAEADEAQERVPRMV